MQSGVHANDHACCYVIPERSRQLDALVAISMRRRRPTGTWPRERILAKLLSA
jgi:hypothetical protein